MLYGTATTAPRVTAEEFQTLKILNEQKLPYSQVAFPFLYSMALLPTIQSVKYNGHLMQRDCANKACISLPFFPFASYQTFSLGNRACGEHWGAQISQ